MTLEEIKQEVSQLSEDDFNKFLKWYEEFKADLWDKQIEEDILAGRLDAFAEEAMRDFEEGRYTELKNRRENVSVVLHPKYITDEVGNRISVVLLIEEYEALASIQRSEEETAYLLKEPANARRLLVSVENSRLGRNIEQHELLPDD